MQTEATQIPSPVATPSPKAEEHTEVKLIQPPTFPNTATGNQTHRPKRQVRERRIPRLRRTREKQPAPTSKWFQLQRRPYLAAAHREMIAQGSGRSVTLPSGSKELPIVYHVDFTKDEVALMIEHMGKCLQINIPKSTESLKSMLSQHHIPSLTGDLLHGRTVEDITNYCSDLLSNQAKNLDKPTILSLDKDADNIRVRNRCLNRVPGLLLAREMEGNVGFGQMRKYENFQNEFQKSHEDGLSVIAEFTNCAGDIADMTWIPDGNIICGTTAHSDSHNQQYNKPGNLLLLSSSQGTLRAFADHRIPRPFVEKGENSTVAMRQSQDPWLYSSVVSTDYDSLHDRAYTSSFDKTVKVWKVAKDGSVMEAIATWHHQGNVNFVAAAKDQSGRVASAADVPSEAVRIYTIDPDNVESSTYHTVSCTRADAEGSDKWAYFPATMQWGQAPGTQHLLAIGYSPRSFRSDDNDIPEDKRQSGEIVLWDASRECAVPVLTATTANVFEIIWHPSLPRFIVSTTPCGLNVEHGVLTQIHIFRRDYDREDGAYSEFQKLDCPASDINELTIMPNSVRHAYITAGCTDGRVYVWDTAQGDRPVHRLKHGDPIADFACSEREKEDTGVKFTAWGTTLDRFYSGSSDGVVKVWNVRNRRRPLVRTLLEAPGPISYGAFSPDHSKLAVGDATGRVFLLSVDMRDEIASHFTTLPGSNRRVRRPRPFIPHPEPPPPPEQNEGFDDDLSIAQYARQKYIESGQLVQNTNPVVGMVQGPVYPTSGLFRNEAHVYFHPQGPLLPEFERQQRATLEASRGPRRRCVRRLKSLPAVLETTLGKSPATVQHEANVAKDLDVDSLGLGVLEELIEAGAQLNLDGDENWDFVYEDEGE